jgi:hypothetical protein
MVAAWWAMLMEDLCAKEETKCAGDDFSESDLAERTDKIALRFFTLPLERMTLI